MSLRDGAQLAHQQLAAARAAFDEPFLAVGLDRRDAGRARERMAGVGQSGPEHVRVEVLRDRLVDDDATERDVARVHALGEGQHVRHHAVVLGREPRAGPPEAGHDLVEDEEDPVLVAERPQTADEPIRRDDEARAADDRLEKDRGDVLRALVPEHLFDVGQEIVDSPELLE